MADRGRERSPATIDGSSGKLQVEVAYALRDEQLLIAVDVEEGATVREAIERSGILQRYPGIELNPGRVGVFGETVKLDTPVREGDRVEIYRALETDPKEARRRRTRSTR